MKITFQPTETPEIGNQNHVSKREVKNSSKVSAYGAVFGQNQGNSWFGGTKDKAKSFAELQQEVGNQKEANRIGQENYDLIYSEDVRMVYAYDKCLNDIGTVVATIVNYIREGVPAATIAANVAPVIQSEIELLYGE